jgi:hypothetical protein
VAYTATAIPVMIASPGDVSEERNLIRDIIHEWNDIHSMRTNSVLMPVGWETHSSPDLGGRPQSLINKNVLEICDLLVGVFWTRIGTPTGEAESGTAEEIRRHVEAGKPAMVYFSTAPVAPEALDADQYAALKQFKEWCKERGLIEEYDNIAAFSDKFRRHLQIALRDNDHLKRLSGADAHRVAEEGTGELGLSISESLTKWAQSAVNLSTEARQLLTEAARDRSGTIVSVRYLNGRAIQTNNINFTDSHDRRSVARWEAALEQLVEHKLIVARGTKNEIFEVTDKGFEFADSLLKDSFPSQ